MPFKQVYIVMVRDKGLYLVEPVEGQEKSATIEAALGIRSGYSAGLMSFEFPEGSGEVWVAWVELEAPNGRPYFDYRVLDGALSEEEATAQLREVGEEPLKLYQTRLLHPGDHIELYPDLPGAGDDEVVEFK